jgi:tetratricopeptide (TPR) repeat protein
MAMDTAELAPQRRPAPDPRRNAWQVPLFLVGAAVFVAAWQGWLPLGTPDPSADFVRDLAALRNSYEKVTPDRDELKDLLTKVAARVDSFPEQATMARFSLGSGYTRLAELTPNLDEARANWTLAKQHFDRIRPEDLKDPADPPRLAFRSAKARAAVGLPANTPAPDVRLLIEFLRNPPFGEEPGDAGRLQADLALKLSPPDLATAKEGLTRFLTASGIATPPASLARAKYVLGDIHFRRKEPDLARKWLEQIGTDAPSDVVAPARFLLGRVRMAGDDWLGATRDLEAVRANPTATALLKATAAYHLGVCKLNTHEWDAAAKGFEQALKAEPPEGIAAAVRLADLMLRSSDPARHIAAVELLTSAVKGVAENKEFRNPLIRVSEVRGVFELAVSTLMTDAAFEPAVKVTEAYKSVAEAGRDREKRAEILAAWSTSLQKSGADFKPKALAAAAEYQSLVELQPAATAKADMLRRAASFYKLGGNPNAAIALLQDATKLPQLPDAAIGPVWVELADTLLSADKPAEEILKAFNQAMASAGSVSTTTRYRLARQFADGRDPRLAPLSHELFRQIAQQEGVGPAEQELHERALVELAHDDIRSAKFAEAEVWLRKQLSNYATGAEAPLGRLLLGVCLIQRASATLPAPPDASTAGKLRDEALKLFKQITSEADDKHKRDGKLSERDAWLRTQAGLRILQTYQQMNKPNDLLAEADKLRDRHRNSIEELIILSLIYHAFKQKGDVVRERQIRDQMKELFDRLPPTLFTANTGEYSKSYWEKVWFTPEK